MFDFVLTRSDWPECLPRPLPPPSFSGGRRVRGADDDKKRDIIDGTDLNAISAPTSSALT